MAVGIPREIIERFRSKNQFLQRIHSKVAKDDVDYRAIVTLVGEVKVRRYVEYYTFTQKGKTTKGVVISPLKNRREWNVERYKVSDVPMKYKQVVKELKKIYDETIWSTSKNVHTND